MEFRLNLVSFEFAHPCRGQDAIQGFVYIQLTDQAVLVVLPSNRFVHDGKGALST